MNKSFLTIAASLAVTAVFLSSAPTISDAASSTTASNTAESRYSASFTVQKPEKIVTPGVSTTADLPEVNDWGFNSHLFIVSRIPCFPTSEVELEPDVQPTGDWVPVLTFEPNPGWEVVEETLSDGVLTTVYFYSTPIAEGEQFTPLFDSWSMTNFKVHSGVCGQHTYSEIIDAVNSSSLERFSLQSDGISGTPSQLWEMVGP